MNRNVICVRNSRDEDRDRILAVHRDAFGLEEGKVIANLVEEMLADPSAELVYSFLAEQVDQVVGYVSFTAVRIETNEKASAQTLAPLAVAWEHHGGGIGTEQIKASGTVLAIQEVTSTAEMPI